MSKHKKAPWRHRVVGVQPAAQAGGAPAPQDDSLEGLYLRREYQTVLSRVGTALGENPENLQFWNLAGLAADALGFKQDAENFWKTALAKDPTFTSALYNLAALYFRLGRNEEATQIFARLLKFEPNHADALNALGLVLVKAGQFEDGKALLLRSLEIRPEHPDVLSNLAMLELDRRRATDAEPYLRRCLAVAPLHLEAQNNMARIHIQAARLGEAEAILKRALQQNDRHSITLNNLGVCLANGRRAAEAEAYLRRSIEVNPEGVEAGLNLGIALLMQGKFEEGWKYYESVHHPKGKWIVGRPHESLKPWNGEDLNGRRLLVWHEQGHGDMIQFCRYIPILKRRYPEVSISLVCGAPLVPFLETIDGIDAIYRVEQSMGLVDFDYWIMPLSIPRICGTDLASIPGELPYLHALAERVVSWQTRLPVARPRIGIAWRGNREHVNDSQRSLQSLNILAPLWKIPGVQMVCLQADVRPGEIEQSGLAMVDLGSQILDFADTAAIVAGLDLVITIDSALAHLAGALGKPCWVLLPFIGVDFRWLPPRTDSPWYPGVMRLFAQPKPGDWPGVLRELCNALEGFVADLPQTDPLEAARSDGLIADSRAFNATAAPAAGPTDINRWSNAAMLDPAWAARSGLAASLIQAGSRVLDLGCGAMNLERFLPFGCTYRPSDVVARDERTVVCDLNREGLPESALLDIDLVTALGVIEYLQDPLALFRQLFDAGRPLLCTYCVRERTLHLDRRALGWVNHYSSDDFVALVESVGYRKSMDVDVDSLQKMYRFELHGRPQAAPLRNVHVLTFMEVPNFGDRLGFHLLSDILPANCNVSWGRLYPLQEFEGPDPDLLVVGIGNSLFSQLLNDQLNKLAERIPTIGLFGTQYRNAWPAQHLAALLDRLEHWYARYEEDIQIYGRGRSNVSHLGDWLIKAFPMTQATLDAPLTIDRALADHPSLDRVIQTIQKHRHVFSTRLHPLLCALTSAETVAYVEQQEMNDATRSGKFRSLLLDVFGREYPEKTQWRVDRDAVAAYKSRVHANVDVLAADLARRLGR